MLLPKRSPTYAIMNVDSFHGDGMENVKGAVSLRANYIENKEQWASEFTFSVGVQVRFSETDMYGHLNNTVPFTYFEYARIEYFKHLGFMKDWGAAESETISVVADLQCDFLQQAFFDDKISIGVKASAVGTSSIDIHYLGKKEDGQPVFTGRGTIVQVNKTTGRSVPWTEEQKRILLGK